jgi:hypothetical protein
MSYLTTFTVSTTFHPVHRYSSQLILTVFTVFSLLKTAHTEFSLAEKKQNQAQDPGLLPASVFSITGEE